MRGVLVVDVGNTTTKLGLFDADAGTPCGAAVGTSAPCGPGGASPVGTLSITTHTRYTADEARMAVVQALGIWGVPAPAGAVLACVVPALSDVWRAALAAACTGRVMVVGPGLKSGIRMRYDDPAEVGADRVADIVAARADYGAPVVVVDLGTTTNFEVVDAGGAFVGGIIAPGLALGAHSLASAAARLPEVELRAPERVIGKNTRAAMQSGVVLGEVARIDGLLKAIMDELGVDGAAGADAGSAAAWGAGAEAAEVAVVITGTQAAWLAGLLHHETVADETLTLRGLYYLWCRNARK